MLSNATQLGSYNAQRRQHLRKEALYYTRMLYNNKNLPTCLVPQPNEVTPIYRHPSNSLEPTKVPYNSKTPQNTHTNSMYKYVQDHSVTLQNTPSLSLIFHPLCRDVWVSHFSRIFHALPLVVKCGWLLEVPKASYSPLKDQGRVI